MASTMKALNCEDYQFIILFDEKNFKFDDFKKELGVEDEDENEFAFNFNSKNKRKKEHAHIQIEFDNDKCLLRAIFHTGKLEGDVEDDVSDAGLEDCVKEVARFLDEVTCVAIITATFQFNKTYEPVMALNFPLLLSAKHLQGAEISGYEMRFPKTSQLRRIFISDNDGLVRMTLQMRATIILSEFNHYKEIQQLIPITQELVRKRGGNNGEHPEK